MKHDIDFFSEAVVAQGSMCAELKKVARCGIQIPVWFVEDTMMNGAATKRRIPFVFPFSSIIDGWMIRNCGVGDGALIHMSINGTKNLNVTLPGRKCK